MPLRELCIRQDQWLRECGFESEYVTTKAGLAKALETKTHIFISPEVLSSSIKSSVDVSSITHVVVDESHCVVKW